MGPLSIWPIRVLGRPPALPCFPIAHFTALAAELRKGTIERVLGMSDLELGLHALLSPRLSGQRYTHPRHCWGGRPLGILCQGLVVNIRT